MNAALHAANPRMKVVGGSPRFSVRKVVVLTIAIVALATVVLVVMLGQPGISGKYAGADGVSVLEFRGSRVYVTTALGTTFVTGYEVDGDRVIIKGAGGAQVYTRTGDTLDGGVGIRFSKQSQVIGAAAVETAR